MATSQNTTKVLKHVVAALENELVGSKLVTREFDGEFKGDIGNTAYVNAPQYFKAVQGSTMTQLQSPNMAKIPIVVDKRYHVPLEYSMEALTLALEDPTKKLFKSIVRPLAVQIDTDIFSMAKDVPNYVGTAGTSINSNLTLLTANQYLTENGVPEDGRFFVMNADARTNLLNALTNSALLLPSDRMKNQLDRASLGKELNNNELIMSQNIYKTTASTALSGSTAILGTGTTGIEGNKTIISGLYTGQTLKGGEVFTIAGINAVNIDNKVDEGRLQQFTVLNTVTAAASACTINFYPPIVANSNTAYQNCTAAPVSGAVVTFLSTASATTQANNLIFTKEAFALVTVPVKPMKNCYSETISYNGIGMTMSADSDIVNYRDVVRFDIMYGFKAINPLFACRVIGK